MEKEFHRWLQSNREKFRSYAPNEIAKLALCCGFPLEIACSEISSYVSHLKRILNFWESPFCVKWMLVHGHETGTDKWEN